jgi:hypothetical protein
MGDRELLTAMNWISGGVLGPVFSRCLGSRAGSKRRRITNVPGERLGIDSVTLPGTVIDCLWLASGGDESIVTEIFARVTSAVKVNSNLHADPAWPEVGELGMERRPGDGQTRFFDHFTVPIEERTIGGLVSRV